jgi:hypothetical protein
VVNEVEQRVSGYVDGKTQKQTGFCNEFDIGGWRRVLTVQANGQKGCCRLGRRRRLPMLFDPPLDGLVGAVELSSDLGDGTTLVKYLLDGRTLNIRRITRLFLGHV